MKLSYLYIYHLKSRHYFSLGLTNSKTSSTVYTPVTVDKFRRKNKTHNEGSTSEHGTPKIPNFKCLLYSNEPSGSVEVYHVTPKMKF